MRNQAVSLFGDRSDATSLWQTDAAPARRLSWLFVLMVIPVFVIIGRIAYLQGVLFVDIVDTTDHTTIAYEPIPARDGRILGSDGRVLAEDVVRYDLLAHYRWIESPADTTWVTRKALARLNKPDRRNKLRVQQAIQAVHRERDAMWSRLARIARLDEQEITAERRRVQERIERMLASVQRRREQRAARTHAAPVRRKGEGWGFVWRSFKDALTAAPKRERTNPLILPEQSEYHSILTDVPHSVAAEIEANPELYPGLRIRISTLRTYPQQSLAAHVVGSRLLISERELQRRRERFGESDPLDYRPGDRIGKTGVERSYDRQLRGRPGLRKIKRSESGRVIETEIVREPQPGRDVVLTLELELQRRMERLLDETIASPGETPTGVRGAPSTSGGCIVAIDVETGEILAAAAAPRFDLNVMIDHDPDIWKQLNTDPRRPFFPRATRMALPPGSVFKTLSAVAVLESGKIDPDATMHCQGFLDRPDKHRCYVYRHFGVGHNDTNLNDAIGRSCNVYFFAAARKLGPRPFVDWADRFGFGQPTGVDLPGERSGQLPQPPGSAGRRTGQRWYPGDTLGLAIGQSRLTATPLQIARMMAAVANDGRLVTPRVVRRIGAVARAGESSESSPQLRSRRIPGLTEGTLPRVREGLERVVQHPSGTGYKRVRIPGITIAGKTGTAEVGGGRGDHAWFAGFVPADRPRIAFAVVLENAGSGGKIAGPVAKKLVESLLELQLIHKTPKRALAN